jgi:hypothetical protein
MTIAIANDFSSLGVRHGLDRAQSTADAAPQEPFRPASIALAPARAGADVAIAPFLGPGGADLFAIWANSSAVTIAQVIAAYFAQSNAQEPDLQDADLQDPDLQDPDLLAVEAAMVNSGENVVVADIVNFLHESLPHLAGEPAPEST